MSNVPFSKLFPFLCQPITGNPQLMWELPVINPQSTWLTIEHATHYRVELTPFIKSCKIFFLWIICMPWSSPDLQGNDLTNVVPHVLRRVLPVISTAPSGEQDSMWPICDRAIINQIGYIINSFLFYLFFIYFRLCHWWLKLQDNVVSGNDECKTYFKGLSSISESFLYTLLGHSEIEGDSLIGVTFY